MAAPATIAGVMEPKAPATEEMEGLPALPCHCLPRGPLELRRDHCLRCGRDVFPVSAAERRVLVAVDGLRQLSAAVEARRRQLWVEIEDHAGMERLPLQSPLIALLRDTHWLRDAVRSGWVPE